ncbi:WH1-domain-containing protein, partial [Leucogyrophana mollusca]
MPAQSALSADEKSKVKSAIPPSGNKILTATAARIYYAHPQPNKWSYGGLEGALAFVRDTARDAFVLKLVDMMGTRGVIWEHELYDGFEYFQDRPFFHSFAGDECMIGFVFADEKDAKTFHKKVVSRKAEKGYVHLSAKVASPEKKKKAAKGGKIDKSMISGPTSGSFVHVAHMGFDAEKGFTSTNVDPSWTAFLGQLESHGIDKGLIEGNMDFIKEFVRDAQKSPPSQPPAAKKKPPPPPAPRRNAHAQQDSVSSTINEDAPAPPPPAPPPPRQPPTRQPPPSRPSPPPQPPRP